MTPEKHHKLEQKLLSVLPLCFDTSTTFEESLNALRVARSIMGKLKYKPADLFRLISYVHDPRRDRDCKGYDEDFEYDSDEEFYEDMADIVKGKNTEGARKYKEHRKRNPDYLDPEMYVQDGPYKGWTWEEFLFICGVTF